MKPNQAVLYAGIGVLLTGVFLIDAWMPLGFTPWLLYVLPLGLTYWATHRSAPIVTAIICTVLIFIGYELSPPLKLPESVALTNRFIGTITFWVLGTLIAGYKLLAQRLSRHSEHLRNELLERTQDLGRAVAALQAATDAGARGTTNHSGAEDGFRIQITEVLAAESRRLRETVVDLEQENPVPRGEEDSLEQTRNELVQLGRQLEQVQRDLLNL